MQYECDSPNKICDRGYGAKERDLLTVIVSPEVTPSEISHRLTPRAFAASLKSSASLERHGRAVNAKCKVQNAKLWCGGNVEHRTLVGETIGLLRLLTNSDVKATVR